MKHFNKIILIALLLLYIFALKAISSNFHYSYLWYDEAGQFWISKGLNHDSPPLSAEGNLRAVIENNKHYNKDPGSFGILLHYWSKFSNQASFLRVLPFLFFTGIILLFIYLPYRYCKNPFVALLMGFLPLFFTTILSMGFEIRAYSMEALAVLICILATDTLKSKIHYGKLLLWSLVLAFFMGSRYSVIIPIFLTSLYILYLIFRQKCSNAKKLFQAAIYALPLLATLLLIYFNAYTFQNSELSQLPYLQYLGNNPKILLKPFNLAYLLLIASLCFAFILRNKYFILKKYEALLWIACSTNICFIIISLMGLHPWRLGSKGCISMLILSLLCFAMLASEILNHLNKRYTWIPIPILLCLAMAIYMEKDKSLYPRRSDSVYPKFDMNYNAAFHFDRIPFDSIHSIYVEHWEAPYIRYEFEYGNMQKEKGKSYPSKFYFSKGIPHRLHTNKDSITAWSNNLGSMNALKNCDLVISSRLFGWASKENDQWKKVEGTENFWVRK